MRKYIIAIIVIAVGGILLLFSPLNDSKSDYSDKLFSVESQTFDQNFTIFLDDVYKNIKSIQSNFKDLDKIQDTTFVKGFLFSLIEDNPYLISTAIISNVNKVAIKKDKKSLVFVIDSTKKLDIVKWQRFENKKLIGSWLESFEEEVNKTPWFLDLKNKKDQIQWLFKSKLDINSKDNIKNELFYAGYSYKTEHGDQIILMEFSRIDLINKFSTNPKINRFNFLIETTQREHINLKTLQTENDSLNISKLNHFKKFDSIDTGTFIFDFKNEKYWNSFKRFHKKSGILYYLLTISDKDLQKNVISGKSGYLNKFAYFLILLGVALLLIKKRFYYLRSGKINIPPVKEILLKDENRYLEFKSSARWDYRQGKTNPDLEKVILKTLAAFGNTDGGILLIGVDDDKNIIGLEKDFSTLKKSTADYYEVHLRNILHKMMGVKYVSQYIRMQFKTCDNQNIICIIKVLAAGEPIYLKFKNKNGQTEEKFYVRSGNSSQEIDSIAEINDYLNSRFKK